MILYALIARCNDGMPLSASTDVTIYNEASVESRKYLKILAKQLSQNGEELCSVKMQSHIVHFVSSFGISYLAMCDSVYPAVLAYSFLNDVQKEFIAKFDMKRINAVMRPYAFIEFDSDIQKLRQRYNNPRTLTTRVSLSEMSAELGLRPPKQLVLSDIIPSLTRNGPVLPSPGCRASLLPMTSFTLVSLVLSGLCCLLGVYRGISALSVSTLEETEGASPTHGLAFLLEAACVGVQIFLLLLNVKFRIFISWGILIIIVLCNLSVWQLQELLLTLTNICVAAISTRAITSLEPVKKLNHNV